MKNGPYELIIPPKEYPGKIYRGKYAYEHAIIWWQNTGETLGPDELIHHKNGQKRDNRFENLEKKTRVEHSREHSKPVPTIIRLCSFCGEKVIRFARTFRWKIKNGQTKFYCNHSCQLRHQYDLGII